MKYIFPIFIVVVFLVVFPLAHYMEGLPVDSEQVGYRGTGIVQVDNPRIEADLAEENQPPDSFGSVEPGGPLASEIYENVQVLGDLTEDEFNHLMLGITQWVAPNEGCAYCHNLENLALDDIYTKVVARRMIQMTMAINSEWGDHVAPAGVNCYTCHRGQHVPENIWVEDSRPQAGGFSANRNGQNLGSEINAYTSLPYDALQQLVTADAAEIRVQPRNGLPIFDQPLNPIQQTEVTYSLMMNMSQGLGVNCTYCHNSRAFYDWNESSPARVKAWHGLEMVQNLNQEYLIPLGAALPDHRKGPMGDAPKAQCSTCHNGIPKPMYGANMLEDHPELGGN